MPIVTTVGSSTINPDLTRAISDMANKAKQQLADTGSLAGFSQQYTGETGGETITISMKAMSMSSYDKSAKPGDELLAFSVQESDVLGDGGYSSGASGTIKSSGDIDSAAKSLNEVLKVSTTPYTSTSYTAADYAQGGAPNGPIENLISAVAASTGTSETGSKFVDALRQQQDAATRLVSALQDFVDGLKGLSASGLSSGSQNSTQSTLKNLLFRLDIKL